MIKSAFDEKQEIKLQFVNKAEFECVVASMALKDFTFDIFTLHVTLKITD